jgi:hypothetical protein
VCANEEQAAVFWIDVAIKAALIGLLLLAVVQPDLPQFEGKAMTGRAIVWELGEYFTFIRGSDEEATAYTDTLGDLTLGTTGSLVAALLTITVGWPNGGRDASASRPAL